MRKKGKENKLFFPQLDIISVAKFLILWVMRADLVYCLLARQSKSLTGCVSCSRSPTPKLFHPLSYHSHQIINCS